jgi:hypothetical protein
MLVPSMKVGGTSTGVERMARTVKGGSESGLVMENPVESPQYTEVGREFSLFLNL